MSNKFNIGDKIIHPKYGRGVVTRIGTRIPEHYYDVDFTGRGGDGTKVWLPKKEAEKVAKVAS